MLQLSDLQAQITSDTGTTLASATINQYINQAFKRLSALVRPVKTTTLTTVNGQRTYILPSDCVAPRQVRLTNAAGQVNLLQQGNRRSVLWPNDTGAPTAWYVDGRVTSGNPAALCIQIGLDPVPDSGNAGLTVTVDYEYRPADLANATDVPAEVPDEFQQAIVFYAGAQVLRYDNPQQSAVYLDLWAQAYNDLERAMTEDQDEAYVTPRDVLPYPGRVLS